MAKVTETKDTARKTEEKIDYRGVIESNGATMDAVMRASDAMLKGMTTFGQEMADFANQRLRQNLETSQSLMGCGDASQAFGVQCDFARTATRQYFEAASKLMTLAAEVSRESWAPIEARTRETLDRMNGR